MPRRSIWEGNISFGLVNIPVQLFTGERTANIPFHLMDKRNNARIKYVRMNSITGKPVNWDQIVKGYEYEKNRYVIINETELAQSLPKKGGIDIECFIDANTLSWIYFDKFYYTVPAKHGEKAYALLRETLKKTQRIAIAHVMIRTHQYLTAIIPEDNVLVLHLLRFPEDIENPDTLKLPDQKLSFYGITPREITLSEKLVNNMTIKWNPKKYHNQTKAIIQKWINQKIKRKKTVKSAPAESEAVKSKSKAQKDNLINFMALLEKSVKQKEKKSAKSMTKLPSKTRKRA